MGEVARKIIDLEWPTRYLLECGHSMPIAADASVADMAMPGQMLACPTCGGAVEAPPSWLPPFKAGEPINALTLNARLDLIVARLAEQRIEAAIPLFTADEPINAETLNRRLREIERHL